MRNYGKSLLAGIMVMSSSLCAQIFPIVKETKKDLNTNLQYNWRDTVKKQQNKIYWKLVRNLVKEYSKSRDGWHYYGKRTETYTHNESWELTEVQGKMEDFYSERFHSLYEKWDSVINHTSTELDFFSKRDLFYQQLIWWGGEGSYGIIVKFMWEDRATTYKICDTIETKDFDVIIKNTQDSPLLSSQEGSYFAAINGWKGGSFKTYLSERSQEEKMLRLLPEYYYDSIKDHRFETNGTLLDKPSEHIIKFADKHWFILKPKILVLKNIDSYDTEYQKAEKIELRWIYIRLPEKKPEAIQTKDTIPQTTQEQIKETEKQMNEIFEYGQKVIFKSNQSEFSNEAVKEWLDKLYEMLEKDASLKIKVTWYYGGKNSTLPLERAEKVKKYLVKKWIDAERIQAQWWKEQIAKSIKIEIIK